MNFQIQHCFPKESIPAFQEFLSKIAKYLEIHPIPGKERYVVKFSPAKIKDDNFGWEWAWERDVDQICWQALCDSWLRKTFPKLPSNDVKGILIYIMNEDKVATQNTEKKNSELIQGEGLASFHAVSPRFKMERLIVTDELKNKIRDSISIIKNLDLIYNEWGFSEVDSKPRLILNFYGPQGTGKTMAAHCIADELNKKIIVANFAEIESKYVGDSPKNLENIFTVAKQEDAVLFFDEADSFLGKRLTSVSSSSDQQVNSLRSKLLQLLEDHSGVVIFCTNLLKNYDKAFESRILRSLKFDLPGADCRKLLIRQMIPGKVPFTDDQSLDENALDILSAASEGFSGREIKNTILQVLCKAAQEQKLLFSLSDFKDGFDVMRLEIETMKKEHGEIDKKHAKKLEQSINEKLKNGDYAVQKSSENENNIDSEEKNGSVQ